MGSSGVYYAQADIVKEFAREFDLPIWQAKEYIDAFFVILIDRLSDDDRVEVRLCNGINIISNYLPARENHLNVKMEKDKMIRVNLKLSRKLKKTLYELNKDKQERGSII